MNYTEIEKHLELKVNVEDIESSVKIKEYGIVGFYTRQAMEYMTEQMCAACPGTMASVLADRINNLKEAEFLTEEQAEKYHKAREICNAAVHEFRHSNKKKTEDALKAWEIVSSLIPDFLKKVPVELKPVEVNRNVKFERKRNEIEKEKEETDEYTPRIKSGSSYNIYSPNYRARVYTEQDRQREQMIRERRAAHLAKEKKKQKRRVMFSNCAVGLVIFVVAGLAILNIRNAIMQDETVKERHKTESETNSYTQSEDEKNKNTMPEETGITDDGLFEYHAVGDVTTITKFLGKDGDIVIPDAIAGRTKIALGDKAFVGSEITSVIIGDNVVEIADGHTFDYVFGEIKTLQKVTIGSGLKTLSAYTFSGCENLTEVTLSEGIERIEENAFRNCKNLTDLNIPKSVTYIGSGIVSGTGVKKLIISAECETASGSHAYDGVEIEKR